MEWSKESPSPGIMIAERLRLFGLSELLSQAAIVLQLSLSVKLVSISIEWLMIARWPSWLSPSISVALLTLLYVDSISEGEMIVSSPLRTISHQRLEFSGGFRSSIPHQGVHKTEWWTPKFSGAVFRSPCN